MRIFPALAVLAGLAACGSAGGPGTGSPFDCVELFQQFDAIEASMSTPGGRDDAMAIPPALQRITGTLRRQGCVTFSDALHLEAGAAPAVGVTDSGPRLVPPVRVHAGAVTSMVDDAAAQAFFEAHGVPATSIGSPALGRRIYIGPFATEGALDAGLALARSAGFASPYPARF